MFCYMDVKDGVTRMGVFGVCLVVWGGGLAGVTIRIVNYYLVKGRERT